MMKLAARVRVTDEHGTPVILTPNDEVPEWAVSQITNPTAWAIPPAPSDGDGDPADEDNESGGDVAGPGDEPSPAPPTPEYGDMTVDQLRALIVSRNAGREDDDRIPSRGSKAALITALVSDDEDQ